MHIEGCGGFKVSKVSAVGEPGTGMRTRSSTAHQTEHSAVIPVIPSQVTSRCRPYIRRGARGRERGLRAHRTLDVGLGLNFLALVRTPASGAVGRASSHVTYAAPASLEAAARSARRGGARPITASVRANPRSTPPNTHTAGPAGICSP